MENNLSINESNTLFLIVSKKKQDNHSSLRAKEFMENNNIPYTLKFVEDLTYEDIKYLVDTISLDSDKLQESLLVKRSSRNIDIYKNILNYNKNNEINFKDLSFEDTAEFINECLDELSVKDFVDLINTYKYLIETPIALKDGIAYVGFQNYDYQQFLIEDRDNPKWMVDDLINNNEEKVDWIINQFSLPNIAMVFNTQLYFPKTSILYGGNIKWEYPFDFVNSDGLIVKMGSFKVKMSVELGNIYKEVEYTINVLPNTMYKNNPKKDLTLQEGLW